MHPGIGQIAVHAVYLGQVPAAALGTDVHLQLLVPAVVAVGQRQVHALIEAQIHGPANQRPDCFNVIIYGIFHILNLPAVAQIPEPVLQILLSDGGNVLGHMAVEAVAHILPVGNALHDAVFVAELLHLQAAQVLCRRAVDGVQVAVRLLEFIDPLVDIFQHLDGEFSVLHQGLAVIQLLEFVQGRDAEAGGGGFQQRLNLVRELQMTAQEAALAVGQRIGRGPHLPQIGIGADV